LRGFWECITTNPWRSSFEWTNGPTGDAARAWLNQLHAGLAVIAGTGSFVYFDTQTHAIGPEHIMASGALPPSFPPIEIERSAMQIKSLNLLALPRGIEPLFQP
jgi:predicted acylesterase/phospholipase RssA